MAVPIPPAPRTIGPYAIVSYLGGGGMAEVFLAVKPGLDGVFQRYVAIKRILPRHVADEQFRSQFAEEVRLVGRLRHPHIVAALDSGKEDGLYYLVLEWIDGSDLAQLLEWCERTQRTVPLPVVLHVAYGVASALSYIHAPPFEVIHRDLSPHNVLLGICGEVKLSDFGISRFPDREYRTRTNLLKGKMAYMSPEQLQPSSSGTGTIDFRSDLFSLGTVLYEMVAGFNPFTSAEGFLAQAQAVLHGNEALGYEKGLRHAPVELARLIRHLHARAPERRPNATDEVVRALRALQQAGSDAALDQLVRACKTDRLGISAELSPLARGAQRRPSPGPTESWPRKSLPPSLLRLAAQQTAELTEHDASCAAASAEPALCVADATSAPDAFTSVPHQNGAPGHVFGTTPGSGVSLRSWPDRPEPPRRRVRAPSIVALAVVVGALAGGALLAFGRDDDALRERGRSLAPSARDGDAASTILLPPPLPQIAEREADEGRRQEPRFVQLASDAATAAEPIPDASHAQERAPVGLERSTSTRRSAEAHATAQVRVVVRPWGRVWIDGKLVGRAPVELSGLTPGAHRIEAGYDRPMQSHVVELRTGKASLAYDLE